MANVVNKLLGENIAFGFDMPLEEKPRVILARIQEYLKQKKEQKDVLLLVDMGSLINFSDELKEYTVTDIRCIELVSTLHVLEASRKAALGATLNEVYESTVNIRGLSTYQQKSAITLEQRTFYLLTLCSTGEGSAQLIKKMLRSRLNLRGGSCEIVSLQVADADLVTKTVNSLNKTGKIICTIGTFQIGLSTPHFSINDALNETNTAKIQALIDYELAFEGMRLNITDMLDYPHGEKLISTTRDWVETLAEEITPLLSYEIKVGLACHVICMIDRLLQGKNVSSFPKTESFKEKYQTEIYKVAQNIKLLETYYGIDIPKDEVFYITAFFMNESFL